MDLRVLGFLLILSPFVCTDDSSSEQKFPDDFLFGAATASYQVEGGWDADGKSPNIWDTLTHASPGAIDDKSNGDVAADSYHLLDEDLKALKETGVQFYRFSIAWARILPKGDKSFVNRKGIAYYNEVINKLIANNILPLVTMYHWDLPQSVEDLGGFREPDVFVPLFHDYAEILFNEFGDRVKYWITFNEPYVFCVNGYSHGNWAPSVKAHGEGEYVCMDSVLKSHASAYHLYKDNFLSRQEGKIGITLNSAFVYPKNDGEDDLVDRALQFKLGWTAHPIYSKAGGYPQVMIDQIDKNSANENRISSRLPKLTDEWKDLIKGSADFFGLNYYTSRIVESGGNENVGENPSTERDLNLTFTVDEKWKKAKSEFLYSVPQGLQDHLKWIKKEYGDIEVFITENGWSDDGELNDVDRTEYIRDHLTAILNAINQDNVNVRAYTAWSIIDNFEWLHGYNEKFGLYQVNYTSPKRERTQKSSAKYYRDVIAKRSITATGAGSNLKASFIITWAAVIIAGLLFLRV